MFRPHPLVAALLLAAAPLTVMPALAAESAEAAALRDYDLPAGPLATVLNRIAREGGLAMTVDAARVARLQSSPVHGRYTPEQALDQALAGTSLQLVRTEVGSYTLRDAPVSGAARELGEIRVTASGQPGTTEGTGSYTTGSMATATRLGLSARETPQSVTVMSRQRMDDRAMTSITEVVQNTPGLFLSSADGPGRPSFTARGFHVDSVMYDGLPSRYQGWVVGTLGNMAMYDRVEVVRGATGLVTGSGSPGAAINLVRKRPTAAPLTTLTAGVGSWDNLRGEVDVSRALNGSGSVRGRVVGSYQDTGTFRDGEKSDHGLFYGVLEADLGERTLLTLGLAHQDDFTNSFWGGLPLTPDGRHMKLKRSTRPSNDWEHKDQKLDTVNAELEHRFDNGWKLRMAAMKSWQDAVFSGTYWNYSLANGYGHSAYQAAYDEDQYGHDLLVSGPFRLLGREHEAAFGSSRRETKMVTQNYSGGGTIGGGLDPATWNPRSMPKPNFQPTTRSRNVTTQDGVYAMTRLSLADPLKLVLGSRLDWYEYDNQAAPGSAGDYKVTRNVTKYGGLIYDLDRRHSVYASYTDIFSPQTSKDRQGKLLEPVVGENYEVGIKGEYFGGALNASAAVFRVDENNRARAVKDPSQCIDPAAGCSEATGLVRSRGVDLELQGALTPSWQVSAGFTYVDAFYLKDDDYAKGAALSTNLPRRLLKLSTSYQLPGELDKWRIGSGVYRQSHIYEDGSFNGTDFRVEQKAYVIADMMLGYQASKQLSLQLNINNVFDKTYYRAIGYDVRWGSTDTYGDPRNAMLTAKYAF